MRNERIAFGESKSSRTVKAAGEITIPDVRWLAVCLDEPEGHLLLWAYRIASKTLERIISRRRWCSVTECFELDVPDLTDIARCFPKHDQAVILEFSEVYEGLVRHFLPKAKPQPYFLDNGLQAGMRFHGSGWTSPQPKK